MGKRKELARAEAIIHCGPFPELIRTIAPRTKQREFHRCLRHAYIFPQAQSHRHLSETPPVSSFTSQHPDQDGENSTTVFAVPTTPCRKVSHTGRIPARGSVIPTAASALLNPTTAPTPAPASVGLMGAIQHVNLCGNRGMSYSIFFFAKSHFVTGRTRIFFQVFGHLLPPSPYH